MKYQFVTLDGTPQKFFYAEHPCDPEKGSFLEVCENVTQVSVKVDRFSTIPFYYVLHEGRLYGSTKLHMLIQSLPSSFPRKLDYPAAIAFLRTNSMISSKTLMSGVERVPHGCELTFNKQEGRLSLREYWRLPGDVRQYDEHELIANLRETFLNVVQGYLVGAGRVGMQLSGGMDSRQILAALRRLGIDFKAFTYGVPRNIDLLVARHLAETLGIEHHCEDWDGVGCFRDNFEEQFVLTDGMQALFHGHGISTYRKETRLVDTVIYGHFLDFFIQAHMYDPCFETEQGVFTVAHLYEKFDGGPCSVMRGDSLEHEMLENEWHGVYAAHIHAEIRKLDYMIPEKRYDALYFVHHGLRRLLPQAQSGAHGVDFFLPGLDREYFELSWSIPGRLRRDRALQKKLLCALCQEVLNVPVVRDNSMIEFLGSGFLDSLKRLRHRLSMRYNPDYAFRYDYYRDGLNQMADAELYDWMKQQIEGSILKELGLLKHTYLRELFEGGHLHRQVSVGHYGALVTLCRFVDTYLT